MADWTEINWTDAAFNPWIGCQKISRACDNCYAWTQSDVLGRIKHWSRGRHLKVWGQNAPRHFQSEEYWAEPLKWQRQAAASNVRIKVFCADMADLFEDYASYKDGVPGIHEQMEAARQQLWRLIEQTPNIEWQLLTKRPHNVRRMTPWGNTWPRNVWIGTTTEDQKTANERIPYLVELPAVVRFLSVEPMLGPIDLTAWKGEIDWVINGAESVTGKRDVEIEWFRSLRDQCIATGIAYWFKQWGLHQPPRPVGGYIRQNVAAFGSKIETKKFAILDGRVWAQFPAFRFARTMAPQSAWQRLRDDDVTESYVENERGLWLTADELAAEKKAAKKASGDK